MTTLGLKNVNMLSKEQYDGVAEPVQDELYAISGSGFGFPSSNYEDLELGASGTTYTAPANGYFYIDKLTSSTTQYVSIRNMTKNFGNIISTYASGGTIRLLVQFEKGDVASVTYNAGGTTNAFKFIYAEGE